MRDFEAIRGEWSALAVRAGSPFLTWEWISTWWRHFGRGRHSLLTACRQSSGELAAILPLYESAKRPLQILRLMGHGPGDHLGLVCAPADRSAAARSLSQLLTATVPGWDVFVGEQMPAEEGWSGLLGGRVVSRESSPILRFGREGWVGYLATRSAHLRKRMRYSEARLARSGELRHRLVTDQACLHADLELLFSLHDARWRERESGAFAPPRQAFHRDFAALALDRGWLRLWFLELDGKPIAVWHGFRFADTEWYYQAGRDPAFDPLSVGFVLLVHTIRAAAEDGMREYRFLSGDEPYKHRLADADPGLETVAMARGAAGRAAVRIGPAMLAVSRRDHGALARGARRVVRLAG